MSFSEVVRRPRSTSAVSPRDVAAKDRIRPPGRVASRAAAKAARPVAATSVQSAPRPSVRRRTSAATSPAASSATAAPSSEASARRSASGSDTSTSPPAQRASCISRRPIGPWPTTSTDSPFATPALRTALRQVLTGSTKAASSGETPSGIGIVPRSTIQSEALHVLRVAAARGLEAGGRAVSLVEGALGVEAPRAVEARPRRGRGGARRRAGPRESPSCPPRGRPPCPRSRGRRSAARAAGPSRSS